MPSYNLHEAKRNLSLLLKRTEQGRRVVITRNGKPVAELVRFVERPQSKIRLGQGAAQAHATPGWEQALSDDKIAALFGGQS